MLDSYDTDGFDEVPPSETAWRNVNVPPRHATDPFACPCCANVFAELINATGMDLARSGRQLKKEAPRIGGTFLLTHARIQTMNPAQPTADSMLVRAGRIAWIGREEDAPTTDDADVTHLNFEDQVVYPGFIDPHMHLAPLAMLHHFHNIGPFRFATTDDALAHLKSVAQHTPAGDWIVARQFDPSLQQGPAALTAELLDGVSREHPVFVYNASLHLAYCNTNALTIAGITAATPEPANAEIGRDASGQPNGVLKAGPAIALVARHNPVTRAQDVAEDCLNVFAHAASLGLTLLCDQGTGLFQGARELDLYAGLRASNRMQCRFRYSLSQGLAKRWDDAGAQWGEGDIWLRNSGWKIVSDGSNQGYTGLQREPFLGRGADERGIAYIEVGDLNDAVVKRLAEGWPVCVHANGDAAIDRVLDAFQLAADAGLDPGARRCRIEHCSILHDEQIDRMATLGISPSFLIGHVHYWGAAFANDIFGQAKAEKLDRTGACEARGIRWTVHSDDPVTEMNPFRCMQNAVLRNLWQGDGVLAPDERVSVAAALRAMTIDAAWQCHSDHEVGSLEVGKMADFVILDRDPLTIDPHELHHVVVEQTWLGGEQVYART